jgi:hypothetical protein
VSEDLTARVAELAALIGAHVAEDLAVAERAARKRRGPWRVLGDDLRAVVHGNGGSDLSVAITPGTAVADHIARNDPKRRLQAAKTTRDLVAAILAERHDYNNGDEFYSCSQAVEYGTNGEPGSGCADPERAGRPCDCGRDARVARLLEIIASEWED